MGPRAHSEQQHGGVNAEGAQSVDKGKVCSRGNYAQPSDLKPLTCGICSHILKNPMQLISCGCRFCKDCIQDYVKIIGNSTLVCPVDEEVFTSGQVKKDKGCMKEIEQLAIECQAASPCGWRGRLSKLEEHLSEDCPNVVVSCKAKCGKEFLRSKAREHMLQCSKRESSCNYCSLKLAHDELEVHFQSCGLCPVTCTYCKEQIPARNQYSKHLEVCTECELECPMAKSAQCKYMGKRVDMMQHVVTNHLLTVVEKMVQESSKIEALEAVNSQICARVDSLEAVNIHLQKKLKERDERATHLEKRVEKLQQFGSKQRVSSSVHDSTEEYDSHTTGIYSTRAATHRGIGDNLSTTGRPNQSHSRSPPSPDGNESRSLATVPRMVPNAVTHMMREMVDKHENQIFHLHSEMQAIQQNFSKCSITLDDLKLRQDIQDVRTTNGIFIWKIPDIRRRYRDALEGKTVSLYSPPFRTSPHGYRMCMRIYLNGDGTGKGTYMSLFFVLMRSEHDDLLTFPFRQSVRFTLLNQVARSDSISEAFAPDLNSQSFQKPESDMNVASGFPKFSKQAILHDENFTKGNSIYIKAQVDLSGLTLE